MPAIARLPCGRRVDVLCGHPEQKNGVRRMPMAGVVRRSKLSSRSTRSANGLTSALRRSSRVVMARATKTGVSSPVLGKSGTAFSSVLPVTRGRRAASVLKRSRTSWCSMKPRFSSTTRISSSPSANRHSFVGSSGHASPTLWSRMPSAAASRSFNPSSDSAWRTSR